MSAVEFLILVGFVYVVVLFFGVPIACGLLAARKGRSVGIWVVLGLFFNLIGLLWLLCVAEDRDALEGEAIASGEKSSCPFCFALIPRRALKCMHCTSILQPLAPDAPVPEPGRHVQFRP